MPDGKGQCKMIRYMWSMLLPENFQMGFDSSFSFQFLFIPLTQRWTVLLSLWQSAIMTSDTQSHSLSTRHNWQWSATWKKTPMHLYRHCVGSCGQLRKKKLLKLGSKLTTLKLTCTINEAMCVLLSSISSCPWSPHNACVSVSSQDRDSCYLYESQLK